MQPSSTPPTPAPRPPARRIGVYGWGVVAPGARNVAALEALLASGRTALGTGGLFGTIDVTAALNRFSLLWSAAILGAVKGTYELTKGYVKAREQFGAPLIKIPAVAAKLAVMRTHVLQAQAAFDRAASCTAFEDMTAEAKLSSTAIARIITSSSADAIARIAHQLHGAIGTTEEYPLHRFTQRLWAWRDFDRTSRDWATVVGRDALRGGEQSIWDKMSVPTR